MSSRIISIEKRLRVLKDFLGNLETIYAADRVPQGAEDHSYIGRINHLFKEGLRGKEPDHFKYDQKDRGNVKFIKSSKAALLYAGPNKPVAPQKS